MLKPAGAGLLQLKYIRCESSTDDRNGSSSSMIKTAACHEAVEWVKGLRRADKNAYWASTGLLNVCHQRCAATVE
jgi:hypothetical protein